MGKSRMRKATLIFILFLVPLPSLAQSAYDILSEVERRQKLVKSEFIEIEMTLRKGDKNTRKRVLKSYTKVDDQDLSRSLIKFDYPPDLKGTGLLTVETSDRDIQKLYLPALKRVQRISSKKRSQKFAGSDFSFEDLGTRKPDEYVSEILEENDESYLLSAKPKESSEYSELLISVDKPRMTVSQILYKNKKGETIKRFEAKDFEKLQEQCFRAKTFTMFDLRKNRSTQMKIASRDTQIKLGDNFFSDRQLSK